MTSTSLPTEKLHAYYTQPQTAPVVDLETLRTDVGLNIEPWPETGIPGCLARIRKTPEGVFFTFNPADNKHWKRLALAEAVAHLLLHLTTKAKKEETVMLSLDDLQHLNPREGNHKVAHEFAQGLLFPETEVRKEAKKLGIKSLRARTAAAKLAAAFQTSEEIMKHRLSMLNLI